MKSSASKTVSSPGRVDKYPPPLMRFLRSNVSSKSRRSRATPLFTRRKRSAIDAEKEPSSPKVTCIGQVKIRRSSSKSKHPSNRDPPPPLRRRPSSKSGASTRSLFCFWIGKPPVISCCWRRRKKSSCFTAVWRKWVSFFCCKSNRATTDSVKNGSNPVGSGLIYSDSDSFEIRRHQFVFKESEEEEDEESSGRVNGSDTSTTPPKNAFLLTRCRSAPHRSSILASQNWGSPLKTEEDKTREQENREKSTDLNSSKIEQTKSAESRVDQDGENNLENCKEAATETQFVGCLNKTETTQKADENERNEEHEEEKFAVLTRCKSEPAKRSGDPLTSSFWREKRFESTVSCRNSVENKKGKVA